MHVRRDGPARAAARRRCASAPTRSCTATCPRRVRACSTATACTVPTARRTATASTRTSCCSTPMRATSSARCAGATRCSATPIGHKRADLSFDRRDSARAHAEVQGHRPGVHLGRRPPPGRAVARHGHLRAARARLHACSIPDVPPPLRGTYAGLATAPVIDYLQPARRHHRRADAGARLRRRAAAGRAGPAQLLGLQHDRLLRARHRAIRRRAR